MTKEANSTRRSFLKSGAVLAAPLAAAAVPVAAMADRELKARLAKLEDEAAIRRLHQGWLRLFNTGEEDASRFANPQGAALDPSVRSIATDHTGPPDAIEIAADGRSAAGRFSCAVEIETAIAPDCTLAEMAHAQGCGFVTRTERRVLNVGYVKTNGAWTIAKTEFAPA